jgi:RHS repeat-associated protein
LRSHHRVEDREEFPHAGNERDLLRFASRHQSTIEGADLGIPARRNEGCRAQWKGALAFAEETPLYYMRARWYDPRTGRFLSEDPIGLAGGVNPSVYGADDPVNGRDPTGTYDLGYDLWVIYVAYSDGRPEPVNEFETPGGLSLLSNVL